MKFFLPFGGIREEYENDADFFYENLIKRLDNVGGIYFGVNELRFGEKNDVTLERIEYIYNFLERIKDLPIEKFILFNNAKQTLTKKEFEIVDVYSEIFNGMVTGSSVTNLYVAEYVSKKFPEIKIDISTNSMVYTPSSLRFWKKYIPNLYSVNVPEEFIRDRERILDLKKTTEKIGIKLKMILNETCVFGCPFRNLCRNLDGSKFCQNHLEASQILKGNWISPSEFHKNFKELIDIPKICHRVNPVKDIFNIFDHYINCDDKINILDLVPKFKKIYKLPEKLNLPLEKLPKKVFSCKCEECYPLGNCDICEKWIKKYLSEK